MKIYLILLLLIGSLLSSCNFITTPPVAPTPSPFPTVYSTPTPPIKIKRFGPGTSMPSTNTSPIPWGTTATPEVYPTPVGGVDTAYKKASETLQRMSESALAGDLKSYVAFNLSADNPRLIEERTILFLNSESIKYNTYQLQITDSSRATLSWRNGKPLWENVLVELRYTLTEAPNVVFVEPFYTSFIESVEEDTWRVFEMDRYARTFFLEGHTLTDSSPHFFIIYHLGAEPLLDDLKTALEKDYARFQALGLGDMLQEKYVIFLTRSGDEVRWLTNKPIPDEFLGYSYALILMHPNPFEIVNQALYLNEDRFFELSPSEREEDFSHHTTHLVFDGLSSLYCPIWLTEGSVLYFEREDYTPIIDNWLGTNIFDNVSLAKLEFEMGFLPIDPAVMDVVEEHAYIYLFIEYLIETYGLETYVDFYLSFGDVTLEELQMIVPQLDSSPETVAILKEIITNRQTQKFFGLSLLELEQEFRIWLADNQKKTA